MKKGFTPLEISSANRRTKFLTGFTLLELLITIVVIVILASIAIPTYVKTMEKYKGDRAITNLKLIRVGEGIYKLDYNRYIDCYYMYGDPLSNLNSILKLEIQDEYFFYGIFGSTATTFTARAYRYGGPNSGEYITINQDGTIDTSNWSP